MKRFDTHVHLWRRGDGHLVRIRERTPELDQDFDLPRLLPELAAASVDRIVLVSAAQNEREPAGLLEIARQHPSMVAGVIGWLELADPDFRARLSALSADPAWLGIRLPIVLDDAAAFVTRPGIDAALDRLAAVDAVVQVLLNPAQIAAVAPLLERHPDLRIVIDHAANPDVARPLSAEWGDGIHRLGALPNAACKVSAFWFPGMTAPTDHQVAPFAAAIISAFGRARIVAAGNWPVTSPLAPPEQLLATCERRFEIPANAFHANATRLYRRPTHIHHAAID